MRSASGPGGDADRVRGQVALVLAVIVGLGVLLLTAAALLDAVANPERQGISPEYAALVQTTLGVLVGGLVGYLGGTTTGHSPETRGRAPDFYDEGADDPEPEPSPGGRHVGPGRDPEQDGLWEPDKQ
jgi:hypothetical protein